MNRPMDVMLQDASGRVSFHMPGHKGHTPYGVQDLMALDTTQLPVTDDFYSAEGAILQAQRRYAEYAGAAETLFLHNGSTAGIHAMLEMYAGEGETVLLPRNAHLSASAACVIGGIQPVWMPVSMTKDGHCYVAESTILQSIEAHPEAKAVLITRPDYFGCMIELKNIVQVAHSKGMRVVVDEAHGAHLPSLTGYASAGELGADAWTQSVHKTLPALTSCAVLHLRDAADRPAAMRVLRREQTSSPSFLLMRSIDDARALMEEKGESLLTTLKERLDSLRKRLPEWNMADAAENWRTYGLTADPTRLVILAPGGGAALDGHLRLCGMDAEMHDDRRVVLLASVMNEEKDFAALEKALASYQPAKTQIPPLPEITALPQVGMPMRKAALAPMELVPLSQAAGRITATSAGLYPPGVPMLAAGEIIEKEHAEALAAVPPSRRFGTEGDAIACVR